MTQFQFIKIYSGLSLSKEDIASELPQAQCCSPVRRGDIVADIQSGVHVIGIIDGEFLQNLAVTPTEVLDAIRVGIKVYGASSMGALRAAELDAFGMIGCGRIYQQICGQAYFSDDHLGVVFEDNAYAQASLPMVDFIASLEALLSSQKISQETALVLQRCFEKLHFSERNLDRLGVELAAQTDVNEDYLAAMRLIRNSEVNQKRYDALELVKRIRHDMAEVERLNCLLNA